METIEYSNCCSDFFLFVFVFRVYPVLTTFVKKSDPHQDLESPGCLRKPPQQ